MFYLILKKKSLVVIISCAAVTLALKKKDLVAFSASIIAETLVRSSRNFFIFIIHKNPFLIKVSKTQHRSTGGIIYHGGYMWFSSHLFSKLNEITLRYVGSINIFRHSEDKQLSRWPNRYIGWKKKYSFGFSASPIYLIMNYHHHQV